MLTIVKKRDKIKKKKDYTMEVLPLIVFALFAIVLHGTSHHKKNKSQKINTES